MALPYGQSHRGARLNKVGIDRGVEIPPGLVVGENPDLDAQRFRRTEKGVCLITKPMIDRLPPQSLEAEQSVLGAILIDRDAVIEVAEFLRGAVDLATQEEGTPVWFALRTDTSTFWIVDAFPGEAQRNAPLEGPIAGALMDNADRLLSAPPEINRADVLASKTP